MSQDGLQQLQESHGPPPSAAPTTPAKSMSAPPDNNYLAYTVGLLARARYELRMACIWNKPVDEMQLLSRFGMKSVQYSKHNPLSVTF